MWQELLSYLSHREAWWLLVVAALAAGVYRLLRQANELAVTVAQERETSWGLEMRLAQLEREQRELSD